MGGLSVAGGLLPVTLAAPAPGGFYKSFSDSKKALWKPGSTLTVTATVSQVGGFSTTVVGPGHVEVTKPQWISGATHDTPRDTDLELTWKGSTVGDVQLVLQGPQKTDKPRTTARCTFAAADAKGAIPAAVLGKYEAGVEGLLSAHVVAIKRSPPAPSARWRCAPTPARSATSSATRTG